MEYTSVYHCAKCSALPSTTQMLFYQTHIIWLTIAIKTVQLVQFISRPSVCNKVHLMGSSFCITTEYCMLKTEIIHLAND